MAGNAQNSPMTLGTRPIGRLLVQYSVPAVISSVVTSLYNIIDSIFISRGVGVLGIAGLAITFPLMNLVIAFCMFVAAGGAALSSIFLGQRNEERAADVLNNVLVLCLIHSVVIGGVSLWFLDDILYAFGANADSIGYARDFMQVILLGTPVSYVFIGLNNIMRATGYPRKAMVSALLSVAVNIVLCPLLIFKFGWGIRGAAFATMMGQTSALIWVLAHFFSKKSFVHFNFKRRWLDGGIVKRIYSIGLAPLLMNICACIVVILINRALLDSGGGGANMAIASYGIINRVTMFFVMIVFGITQGMQPILGFNYGARDLARVKKTLRIGIIVGVCVTSVGWLASELFPTAISGVFTVDPTLIAMTDRGFRLSLFLFPVVGCQIVIQNFFQAIGHPVYSIVLSLTRQLIFLTPFLLILPKLWGIDGVWCSMAASDILAFIIALLTLLWTMHSHRSHVFH